MKLTQSANAKENKRRAFSLRFLFVVTFSGQMIMGIVGLSVPIYANFLGASQFIVGLIGSAGGLIYSFMPLVSGTLSDRFNRKAFVGASLIAYGFSCLLYPLVEEPSMLVFIKILEWLAVATFWPAIEALIVDSNEERLEVPLQRFNVSWGSAMVIGPIIGGALISVYSVKAPFLLALLIAFSTGLLSFIIIKEPPRRVVNIAQQPTVNSKDNTEEEDFMGRHAIIIVLSSIFLFSSVDGIILSLFPAYATELGIPAYEIGLITFAFGAARVVTFFQANGIEAKIGKLRMFLIGSMVLAFASFLIYESLSTVMFTICFLFFGFASGITYAPAIAFVLKRWGGTRGAAAGIFESLIGVGFFIGPLTGGIVSVYASNAPYILSFIVSIAVFAIQAALSTRKTFSPPRALKKSYQNT